LIPGINRGQPRKSGNVKPGRNETDKPKLKGDAVSKMSKTVMHEKSRNGGLARIRFDAKERNRSG
jgi:hypothetical protein